MAWWKGIASARIAWIVVTVTATHVALAAILLSFSVPAPLIADQDVLEITIADFEPPPPEPEPEPEPDPEPPRVAETPQASVQSEPAPPPSPAQPSPELDVLVQRDPADSADIASAQSPTSDTPSDTPAGDGRVTPGQVANILAHANCLKLKRHEEGACPPVDPFDAAIAAAERDIPPEQLYRSDPRYVAQTVDDKMFEAEAAKRFHWHDEDLFTDPLAPGTYNARRIRNGQEPLWSQEIRDGFTKDD